MFKQRQTIVRVFRAESDCRFQMLPGFAAAANADGPSGSVLVQQTQRSMRTSVVVRGIERDGGFKRGFHFIQKLQRTEPFGARQLAEIQAEIILSGSKLRVLNDGMPAGGNALLGNFGPLRVVRREIRPIEARASEVPCDLPGICLAAESFAGPMISTSRPLRCEMGN